MGDPFKHSSISEVRMNSSSSLTFLYAFLNLVRVTALCLENLERLKSTLLISNEIPSDKAVLDIFP